MLDTRPARPPQPTTLTGQRVTIVPLDAAAHSDALHTQTRDRDDLWTYLPDGPYADGNALEADLAAKALSTDPLFFAIVERTTGRALGVAAYLRIDTSHRVIEVGHILLGLDLQRTTAATEAMYLMARHVFEDLGYRRYEWKCDARNVASRRAAERLGFTFEGVFRQHMIRKGQNRDTAWFSMLDSEWPDRRVAFEAWLDGSNFDNGGRQVRTLESFRRG